MIVPLMEEDAEKNLVINSGTKNFNITDNPDWLVKPLSKEDYYAVKALCTESFPVKYPESFYEDVVEGRFIAFGYFYKDVLTSLMICEIKAICEYEARDRKLLSDGNGHALYILSLAVRGKYRRKGIASALLSYLLNVIVKECPHVGVIFLHAVTYNYGAIKFYKESGFKLHTTLKNYYLIEGIHWDGYTFAYYVNGNKDPRWCLEMLSAVTNFVCCPLRYLLKHVIM